MLHQFCNRFLINSLIDHDDEATALRLFAVVAPTAFSDTKLTCPSPKNVKLAIGDVVVVQVTLNRGVSFISSNVTIASGFCVGFLSLFHFNSWLS